MEFWKGLSEVWIGLFSPWDWATIARVLGQFVGILSILSFGVFLLVLVLLLVDIVREK